MTTAPDDPADDLFERRPNLLLYAIMAGVLAWGVFHTVGVFLASHDPAKGLMKSAIVAVVVIAFLGAWLLLLAVRAKRSREDEDAEE